MALDILIRYLPSLRHVTIGRSFYTQEESKALPGAAEMWSGYYQSVRPGIGKKSSNRICLHDCLTTFTCLL